MTDPVKRQKTGDTGLPTVRVGFRNPEMEKNGTIRSPFGDYAEGGFFLVWGSGTLLAKPLWPNSLAGVTFLLHLAP